MINTPTPHNEAKLGDIAKVVLMPGDPLRAKYIAENFLENVVQYNHVRGMNGYTGEYNGVKVSVQGSGMGIPSIGIYSMELFDGYDVDTIIRVGSAGSMDNEDADETAKSVNVGDIIIARDAITDSNYANANGWDYEPTASEQTLEIALRLSSSMNNVKVGTIYSSDSFYMSDEDLKARARTNTLGVEMETFGLYMNAKKKKKNALGIFTCSDKPLKGEGMSSQERETGLNQMIKLALDIAVEIEKER